MTPADPTDLDHPSLYINRELSWLEFNRRVLEEAVDLSVPLLERLKFLAIFSSNLDEFFMVRVGGLHQKVRAGINHSSGGDRTPPAEQLRRISERVRERITPMRLEDGMGVYTAIGGTEDFAAMLGLAAAVKWAQGLGQAAVHDRIMSIREQLYAALAAQPGITINSAPPGSPMASHLVCFTLKDHEKVKKADEQFAKDKIVIKTVHHGGIDYRVGGHVYTRPEDVDRLAASLKAVLG